MPSHSTSPIFSRRRFLRYATAIAAAGASTPALAGCQSDNPSPSSASRASHVSGNSAAGKTTPPTHVPYTGVKADLPGNADGVLDGFLTYPANPIAATTGTPGDGGDVSAMVLTNQPLPPTLSSNHFLQALNSKLGVTLSLTETPSGEYPDKIATTLAGGSLPDFLQIHGAVPQLPGFLEAKCQDLTEYLAGDAIKQYPLLANIPSACWPDCTYEGRIYGLPTPRAKLSAMMYYRADLLKSMGVSPQVKSFTEFTTLCRELTDVRRNRWALADVSGTFDFVRQMLGAANDWQSEGGKLVNNNEQEQTKQALAATAQLVKNGYAQPDSVGSTNEDQNRWFAAGTALLDWNNFTAWPGYYTRNTAGAAFDIDIILPPDFDGGSHANTWQGDPNFSFTVLKKADPKRIAALLRVANWLAAPFGTAEYLFTTYGLADTDYHTKDGDIVKAGGWKVEVSPMNLGYIVSPPYVIYNPGQPDVTKDEHAIEAPFLAMSVPNPVTGLYSATAAQKRAALDKQIDAVRDDILQGRKSTSDWDAAVKAWRSAGGDTIRAEYEEAIQQSS